MGNSVTTVKLLIFNAFYIGNFAVSIKNANIKRTLILDIEKGYYFCKWKYIDY